MNIVNATRLKPFSKTTKYKPRMPDLSLQSTKYVGFVQAVETIQMSMVDENVFSGPL